MNVVRNWYEIWFDSRYGHLRYRAQNGPESNGFVTKPRQYRHPGPGTGIMELACSRGRPTHAFAAAGYDVRGIDLSGNGIQGAKKLKYDDLVGCRHQMRLSCSINYFDDVFNGCTSVGYFDNLEDDGEAHHTICSAVKRGGMTSCRNG